MSTAAAILPVTHTRMGYSATRERMEIDGNVVDTLIIHNVPIFCACERGEGEDRVVFGDRWIKDAVAEAKLGERSGYLPPLHIRHHPDPQVRAVGVFKILGAEPFTLKGKRRITVFADLIITDTIAQSDILAMRVPYRSVEIFDVASPKIDGLSLLDHEAPFLELPMTMIASVTQKDGESVPPGTFQRPWHMHSLAGSGPMVACFRRGSSAFLLFREDQAMTKNTEDETKAAPEDPATQGALFADGEEGKGANMQDEDDKDDDKEDMQEGGLDVSSVVKAIESGEISVADMDAILAAIQSQGQAAEPEEETPAPAPAPGAEVMKREHGAMSEQMAAIAGENRALTARLDDRDANDQRKTDVAEAMALLEGRPMGADIEAELFAYHKDHGRPAFAAYVKGLVSKTAILFSSDNSGAEFHASVGKAPEVAMKYIDQGSDAVDQAARFCAQWQQLNDKGLTKIPEERWVANNMARESAKRASA